MQLLNLAPLPTGTQLIDGESREPWVIAYCEAVSLGDPFGPYAYGCINSVQDERVVFHTSISIGQDTAVILPR